MVKFSNISYNYLGDIMKMINNNISNELIIKNSKFICLLYKIDSMKDIDKFLIDAKNLYPKATHYCYSYIFQGNKKAFDDGEPAKTAGLPILNILEHKQLENILCIVVRYFGGIKLGTGGLVRAYSQSVRDCLSKTTLNEVSQGYLIKITTNYENIRELDYLLNNWEIINKEFLQNIIYIAKVNIDMLDVLDKRNYLYEILDKCYILEK